MKGWREVERGVSLRLHCEPRVERQGGSVTVVPRPRRLCRCASVRVYTLGSPPGVADAKVVCQIWSILFKKSRFHKPALLFIRTHLLKYMSINIAILLKLVGKHF